MTLSIDIQHNSIECHYAECHYAECRNYINVMLNVVMLSVIRLKVVMLSVVAPTILTWDSVHKTFLSVTYGQEPSQGGAPERCIKFVSGLT